VAAPPPRWPPQARSLHQNTVQQQQVQQQQQQQQQQHVLQQHVPRRSAGDPVSMNRGTLLLGGMALLAGGVALGTQAQPHMASFSSSQAATASVGIGPASSASTSQGSSAAAQPHMWQRRGSLVDFLPPFLSQSHAQAHTGNPAAMDPRGSSSGGAGGTPLGGCLSPHFISDAAAKAAPAVVNM
jgi:hypothetical protein